MISFPKQKDEDKDTSEFPNFEIELPFFERCKKPLTLKSTARRQQEKTRKMASDVEKMKRDEKKTSDPGPETKTTVVSYSEEDIDAFKENLIAQNTKKSTDVAIRRLKSWYKEKYQTEINLDQVSKAEAPEMLKHFFIEIRQTTKENKGKEYEPGSLQTYRNGLRRYFLEQKSPPAVDNFDIDKSGAEFEEVAKILSLKKKDLKMKGLGNKPNAAKPIEDQDVEKMWTSGAIGLHSRRALLRLVWWNNMMHLGMRGFQEQRDCQLEDFLIQDNNIEYTERQTKNRQGNEGKPKKRARKYNNKIFKTDGSERDPYRAFVEYTNRRPKGDAVPNSFFLSPVDNPKSDIWYKKCAVGVNTLSKMMAGIKSAAGLQES